MTKQISITFALFAAAAVMVSVFTISPNLAVAGVGSTISDGLDDTAEASSFDVEGSLPKTIGNLIKALLSFTGIIFLVITVYAGVLYMTAAGDEGKVKKAKDMLVSSVIGLIIVVAAYAITAYVIDAIGTVADSQTST
jgi:hypothetical protein